MAIFSIGSFTLDLGVVRVPNDAAAADERQCAWELYLEMTSRDAVCGKLDGKGELTFAGEILSESFESLDKFFNEVRSLLRRYPVTRLNREKEKDQFAGPISRLLNGVLRPFLERWHAHYRHGCAQLPYESSSLFGRQEGYEFRDEMQAHWKAVRKVCREVANELKSSGAFPQLLDLVPPDIQGEWLEKPPGSPPLPRPGTNPPPIAEKRTATGSRRSPKNDRSGGRRAQ